MKNTQENYTKQLLDEELTAEEELEISGYQPQQVALIDKEYLIQRDGEQAEARDESENPLIRGAIAIMLVGAVMGFGWMVWSIFFAAKPIAKTTVTPKPTPLVANSDSDEASRLKAELALRNQKSRTVEQPQKQLPPSPQRVTTNTIRKPLPEKQARTVNPPPPIIIRETVSSPPRIIRERVPVQLQPSAVATVATPFPTPVRKIDPFERWNELATLGQQIATNDINKKAEVLAQKLQPNNESVTQLDSPPTSNFPENNLDTTVREVVATSKPAVIAAVAISSSHAEFNKDKGSEQIQTPGEWGILNRTPPNSQQTTVTSYTSLMEVQIGSTATASVLVPMIWAEEDKNQGRFAVELQEDILSTDNRIALPKGTILITEVDSVSKANKLVKQSVVAIVYSDASGRIQQQTIPKDAILIRGENNKPLVAVGISDKGTAIAQQDILVGLLGAAGRAGEIFNSLQSQSSTVISNGGFSNQTITTQASKPNIVAAAVEGFFKPMSQRLGQRADKANSEIMSRPDVAIVPAGTKVSIFFNSFFEVSR